MLELKSYSKPELTKMFGTKNSQGLKRKFERYGISFTVEGRGESAVFTINAIENPFKIYCITELGMAGNTNFYSVAILYYYFFNDIKFSALPDEVKENRLRNEKKQISRQCIAKYLSKLDKKNFILKDSGDYIYYFAHKDIHIFTEKSQYSKAWQEYWAYIHKGMVSQEAIYNMKCKYGGVARKQAIPIKNAFYLKEIEYMCNLIQAEIDKEIDKYSQTYNIN